MLTIHQPYNPAVPLLVFIQGNVSIGTHKDLYTRTAQGSQQLDLS